MAKTLIRFENELIDIAAIYQVSRKDKFNTMTGSMGYDIILNPEFPDSSYVRNVRFSYSTPELRDNRFEELVDKIAELEHVIIL